MVFDVEGSYLLHKITKSEAPMDHIREVFTVEAYVEPEDEGRFSAGRLELESPRFPDNRKTPFSH